MVHRYAGTLIGVLLGTSLSTFGCAPADGTTSAASFAVGNRAPAFWSAASDTVPVVGWVFRGNDYLGCQSNARELRRLQGLFGSKFRLSAVYVGSRSSWVAPFLRRERLTGELILLDEAEYRRLFKSAPLPSIYLVKDGLIIEARYPADGAAVKENLKKTFELILQETIQETDLPGSGVHISSNQARS